MHTSKKGKRKRRGKEQKLCFEDNRLKAKEYGTFNKLKEKYLLPDR